MGSPLTLEGWVNNDDGLTEPDWVYIPPAERVKYCRKNILFFLVWVYLQGAASIIIGLYISDYFWITAIGFSLICQSYFFIENKKFIFQKTTTMN